jgi:hypothetical protein
MVDRRVVEALARVHASPAVSIFSSTDRERPGNQEGPRRLRVLVDEARRRLVESWGEEETAKLVDRLERAGAGVDWGHPGDAVAIYATADEEHVFMLPIAVRDRVVIEETFATRELLLASQRAAPYRVLALSEQRARLFEGSGTRLEEVVGSGFPVDVEAPKHTGTPHRDLPVHDPAAGAHRFVFRAVDRALNERSARAPLPIVVVAPERDLAYFDEVTAHDRLIVARVAGDHTRASAGEIATVVAPHVERALVARRHETIEAIERAAGEHRVALDVIGAWIAAVEGRGRLLVVEDGYTFPARLVDGVLVPSAGTEGRHALDDAVDEIIEAVLVNGGDAVIVEPGQLGPYAPIALALRY